MGSVVHCRLTLLASLLYLSFNYFDQPLLPDLLPSTLVELDLGE